MRSSAPTHGSGERSDPIVTANVSRERNGHESVSNGGGPRGQETRRRRGSRFTSRRVLCTHWWFGVIWMRFWRLREERQQVTCDDVRPQLLHYRRGQLSTVHRKDVRVHLQACPACAHEVTADALLTEILERQLPRHT